jgi:hypothetical protein
MNYSASPGDTSLFPEHLLDQRKSLMRVGFTGTRHCSAEQGVSLLEGWRQAVGSERLDSHHLEFITGGCVGWDSIVGVWALLNFPLASHTVILPTNERLVDRWWESDRVRGNVNLAMREGRLHVDWPVSFTRTYRDRNQLIVNLSDMLLYCAEYPEKSPESTRSGTWQTVRLARKTLDKSAILGWVLNPG